MRTSSKTIPAENDPIFPVQEPREIYEKRRISMKTGLTKKQKVTEVYTGLAFDFVSHPNH